MDLYRSPGELRQLLDRERARGRQIGMVGTSGGMHEGHQSLIRRAAEENDVTALYWGGGGEATLEWQASTIAYARDADHDFPLAEAAGCDILFAPPSQVMFPREPMTKVSLPAMSTGLPQLEDPAHLDLIALAMCKLWNMFGPCRNYFGEKDWQQLVMFQRLADDLAFPVEVLGCPTVREEDGVAVSSRNAQLTAEQRAVAPVLYGALCTARDAAIAGTRTSAQLEKVFAAAIDDPDSIRYFAAVEADTMAPLEELNGTVRLLASIELGPVRLLDNLGIELGEA
jgi:pantoate--beta-alanine ligase